MEIRFTSITVEVLFKNRRVASHARSFRRGGFTTLKEHMPKAHQKYLEWTPSRKPGRILENLGDEARVDKRGLFHYGIELIKDRYFVRVVIQDKSEKGLNTAILFSRFSSQKIK